MKVFRDILTNEEFIVMTVGDEFDIDMRVSILGKIFNAHAHTSPTLNIITSVIAVLVIAISVVLFVNGLYTIGGLLFALALLILYLTFTILVLQTSHYNTKDCKTSIIKSMRDSE